MRYLKNVDTAEVTEVPDDDDKQFYGLLAERRADQTPLYVQTGAHDPAVDVLVPGQSPANGETAESPGASEPTSALVPAVDVLEDQADEKPAAKPPAKPADK